MVVVAQPKAAPTAGAGGSAVVAEGGLAAGGDPSSERHVSITRFAMTTKRGAVSS